MKQLHNIKSDFPILNQTVNGFPLTYLDSGATSQKPQIVIDAITEYYQSYNANVRRGLYALSEKATAKVEEARGKVAAFINAASTEEIIFTHNATEAINLVAYSASHNILEKELITTTIMEHHSNFVPWQQIAMQKAALFAVLKIDASGDLVVDENILKSTKILAIVHVSNTLGTINPIKAIITKARTLNPNIIVVVDAAQSIPHIKVDVRDLDADFLVFSGHKMMAGTGVGVLYGKKKQLEKLPPFLFGGEMIQEVGIEKTTFAPLPHRFEAGTPAIADIISLGVAVDYLESIGMENVANHEVKIMNYALDQLKKIDGITIYGPKERAGVISFNLDGVHAHDVSQVLADMGVCIRAGHHCTMPLHKSLGIPASARASFYIYNDESDVDRLIEGIKKVKEMFKK